MESERARGTGKSSAPRVMFRICAGFLKIVLNVAIYAVVIWFVIRGAKKAYDFAYEVMDEHTMEAKADTEGEADIFIAQDVSNEGSEDENEASVPKERVVNIQILQGESVMNIAAKLETNRIIGNKYSFYVRAQINSLGAKAGKGEIQAGTYKLKPTMTYKEILNEITNVKNSIEATQTVEEAESLP